MYPVEQKNEPLSKFPSDQTTTKAGGKERHTYANTIEGKAQGKATTTTIFKQLMTVLACSSTLQRGVCVAG